MARMRGTEYERCVSPLAFDIACYPFQLNRESLTPVGPGPVLLMKSENSLLTRIVDEHHELSGDFKADVPHWLGRCCLFEAPAYRLPREIGNPRLLPDAFFRDFHKKLVGVPEALLLYLFHLAFQWYGS